MFKGLPNISFQLLGFNICNAAVFLKNFYRIFVFIFIFFNLEQNVYYEIQIFPSQCHSIEFLLIYYLNFYLRDYIQKSVAKL